MFYISFSSIIGTWSCLYVLLKCPYKILPCQIMQLFFETLFSSVAVELIPYTWLLHYTSLSLFNILLLHTRPEITKQNFFEHSSRYEVNNSIKLLTLYGFFVLKKNYFFTFTAHEYDGLIMDGHNMNFFANKFGK